MVYRRYFLKSIMVMLTLGLVLLGLPAGGQGPWATRTPRSDRFLARIHKPSNALVTKIRARGYDIAAYRPGRYLDLVMDQAAYRDLEAQGADLSILASEADQKSRLRSKTGQGLPGYRDYARITAELMDWQDRYPDICRVVSIGGTWGEWFAQHDLGAYADFDHEILAVKISDHVAAEEDEPGIYFIGGHHAREPISVEVTLAVLADVLENYGSDATITRIVDQAQLWFIPVLNPDGHKIVLDRTDVWWRKNLRDNNHNAAFDAANQYGDGPDGVDLNRNYGFRWGLEGASDLPEAETYHGPSPWSEPEVRAIKRFLDTRHFVAGISYHSYGEWVLYPYGYETGVTAPDHLALKALAEAMAAVLPRGSAFQTRYTPAAAWELYPVMGDHCDFAYGVHGIFAYTIEIGTRMIPDAAEIDAICQDQLEAARILMQRPFSAVLTGHVTDAASGMPIAAQIVVQGIDDSSGTRNTAAYREPYQSDGAFGRFYRLLEPGTYTVTFQAEGYGAKVYEAAITADAQSVLEVELEKVADVVARR